MALQKSKAGLKKFNLKRMPISPSGQIACSEFGMFSAPGLRTANEARGYAGYTTAS
jgi:hypothetical protein